MSRATVSFLALGLVALLVPTPGSAQDVAQQPRVAAAGSTHVVQAGETLGSIAERRLGSAALWREIFDANRDRLQDPNRIRVGMELVIPGRGPAAEEAGAPAARAARVGVDLEATTTDHVARRELVRPRPFRPEPAAPPAGDRTIFFEAHHAPDQELGQVMLAPADRIPAVPEGVYLSASWSLPASERIQPMGMVVGLAGEGVERPDRTTVLPTDLVMVRLGDGVRLSPGERFRSVRLERERPGVGHVLVPTAVFEVVRVESAGVVARMERDIGKAQIDDLVFPVPDFPLVRGVHPAETELRLQATVLGFEERKELYLPGDRLFIDRGSRDGVAVGDEFAGVAGAGDGWDGRVVGQFQVVHVQEGRATLRILRTSEPPLVQPGLQAMLTRKMP